MHGHWQKEDHTFRCPRKCCNSLISLRARFARIFLLKTFVTFLIATPSPFWLLVAALWIYRSAWSAMYVAYIPDNSISALSQLFRHSVSFINYKVLVEDLDDLSS